MFLNDVYFCTYKCLARLAKAVNCKQGNRADENPDLEELSLLNILGSLVPLEGPGVEILDEHQTWNVTNEAPAESGRHLVSLCLHKKPVTLLVKLMERNLRLVLVLVLHLSQLSLPLRLVLQVRVVEFILTLYGSDSHFGLLLSNSLFHELLVG